MAAGREIHSSIRYSATLAALPDDFTRLLFFYLLAQSDNWGRLEGELSKVMQRCIPEEPRRTPEVVEGGLHALHHVRRIQLYRANGSGRYMQIVDFDTWNTRAATIRKGRSRFPEPPPLLDAATTTSHDESRRDHDETARLAAAHARAPMEVGSDVALASEQRLFSFPKDREGGVGGGIQVPGVPLGDVERVYAHWRQVLRKTDRRYERISPERFRTIALRLRDFSADELCAAIDAVANDPWPERRHHDDLIKIFQSREHVDRWLDRTTPLAFEPPDDLQAYVRA